MISDSMLVGRAVTVSAGLAFLVPSTFVPLDADADAHAKGLPSHQAVRRQVQIGEQSGWMPGTKLSRLVPELGAQVTAAMSARPTRAARMAAVWARIQDYGKLDADWAGPGTVAPSASTIGYARTVLATLPAEVDVPLVAASGDGEVVFTWLANGDRLEAAIDEDGFLSWATRISGAITAGGSINLAEGAADAFQEVLASRFA